MRYPPSTPRARTGRSAIESPVEVVETASTIRMSRSTDCRRRPIPPAKSTARQSNALALSCIREGPATWPEGRRCFLLTLRRELRCHSVFERFEEAWRWRAPREKDRLRLARPEDPESGWPDPLQAGKTARGQWNSKGSREVVWNSWPIHEPYPSRETGCNRKSIRKKHALPGRSSSRQRMVEWKIRRRT